MKLIRWFLCVCSFCLFGLAGCGSKTAAPFQTVTSYPPSPTCHDGKCNLK